MKKFCGIFFAAALLIVLSASGCISFEEPPVLSNDSVVNFTGVWNAVAESVMSDGAIVSSNSNTSFVVLSQEGRLFECIWKGMKIPGGIFNQAGTAFVFDAGSELERELVYGTYYNGTLVIASSTYNSSSQQIGASETVMVRANDTAGVHAPFSIAGNWHIVSAEEMQKKTITSLNGTRFIVEHEKNGIISGMFEADVSGVVENRNFVGSCSFVSDDASRAWYNVITADGEFWKLKAEKYSAGTELMFWTTAVSESGSKSIATIKRIYTSDGNPVSPVAEYPDMVRPLTLQSMDLLSNGQYIRLVDSRLIMMLNETAIQNGSLVYRGITKGNVANNYWDMGLCLTYQHPGMYLIAGAATARENGAVILSEGWVENNQIYASINLAPHGESRSADFTIFVIE